MDVEQFRSLARKAKAAVDANATKDEEYDDAPDEFIGMDEYIPLECSLLTVYCTNDSLQFCTNYQPHLLCRYGISLKVYVAKYSTACFAFVPYV